MIWGEEKFCLVKKGVEVKKEVKTGGKCSEMNDNERWWFTPLHQTVGDAIPALPSA